MNSLRDILARRMEAHRAACEGLEQDILIQHAFGTPAPIKPLKTPLREGALLRRQAA